MDEGVNEMTAFDFGTGPVPAHQHPNGGGWVADTATDAEVSGYTVDVLEEILAVVSGDTEVSGNARVSGNE